MSPADRSLFQRHAWWLALVPFGLWCVAWAVPWPMEPGWVRRVYRLCGYAGAVALFIPYLHIARTVLLPRRSFGGQTRWLRWHIGAAFIAFVLVLVHCRGHAHGFWTLLLLALFWLVMLSGTIGYWVRILIYRYLAITLRPEFGRARLRTKERLRLQRRAARLMREYWKLTEYDVSDWPSFCRDLSEKPSPEESLWEQAAGEVGSGDAKRMLTHVRAGNAFQFGEPNPVIGTLAKYFKRAKCCTLADFQTRATATNLSAEETSRRDRLHAAAKLVFERESALVTLKTCLAALAGQLTDAQRIEYAGLWQQWDAAKQSADPLNLDTLKKHKEPIDAVKKKLAQHLKWPTEADLIKARAFCDQMELTPVGGGQLSAGEVTDRHKAGREIRTLLTQIPPLPEDLRARLKKLHDAGGALLKVAVGAVLSTVDIDGCRQWRQEVDEVWASEPIVLAGSLVESANGLLKVVQRMIEDEVGRRNRHFLEMLCPQVVESQPPSALVNELYEKQVEPRLANPSPSWGWLFTPAAREAVPINYLQAVRTLITPQEERLVNQLVRWAKRRRQLDVEDWTDRLANHWLHWHAWSAALLFVVVVDHIVGSIRFGGY